MITVRIARLPSAAGSIDLRSWRSGSTVAFAADHVDHAESRDDVGDHPADNHLVERAHRQKAGRTYADTIGAPAAIADDEESQLAVAPLDILEDLADRDVDASHDQLEMTHQ